MADKHFTSICHQTGNAPASQITGDPWHWKCHGWGRAAATPLQEALFLPDLWPQLTGTTAMSWCEHSCGHITRPGRRGEQAGAPACRISAMVPLQLHALSVLFSSRCEEK